MPAIYLPVDFVLVLLFIIAIPLDITLQCLTRLVQHAFQPIPDRRPVNSIIPPIRVGPFRPTQGFAQAVIDASQV